MMKLPDILRMPKEDLFQIMNMGGLNKAVMGYIIDCMKRAGIQEDMIQKTINCAHASFDEIGACDAEKIYQEFGRKPVKRRGR